MRHLKRWTLGLGLWPRMSLAISAGFLVLFGAFLVLSERALDDSTTHILNERLVVAQMASSQMDALLVRAISELEQARRFADFDPSGPDLSAEIHVLAHTYGRVGTFTPGITFIDTQGRVLLSHPPNLYPSGTNLSALEHVTQALERRDTSISAPFSDPLSGEPVVAVTIPINDDEGQFLGLLSGLIDLKSEIVTTALHQAAAVDRTGHAILVDSQGRVLASTFQAPILMKGEHVTFYREALALGQPTVEKVPLEWGESSDTPMPDHHVMAFASLSMAPWGVAVGGDAREIFAGVRRLRLGLAVLGTITLAGTWAATLIGTRFLLRPVENLTETAQRIAAGDLDTPLQTSEGGEIETLADALERMRRQLLIQIQKLAAWNEDLETRVAERTEALHWEQTLTRQLLRRVIAAQEEERARLSREMHDEIGQTLTAVQIGLDRTMRSLSTDHIEARDQLAQVRELTTQALVDLRRIIAALRPGVLDQLGLVAALNWVAKHTLRPLDLRLNVDAHDLHERLPSEIETILFRIAQEAMSNVARHSGAEHVEVCLSQQDNQVLMSVADDGRGFNLASVSSNTEHRLGLASMQERASLAGGQVRIESAPRRGTTVHVSIPISEDVPGEVHTG